MIESILIGVVLLMLAPYALLPLVIRGTCKITAEPDFNICDPDTLEPRTRDFIHDTIERLNALGFEVKSILHCPQATQNVRNYLAVMANPATKTLGFVTVIESVQSNQSQIRTQYVEFVNKFADETNVCTLNSSVLGSFPLAPKQTKIQVPHLTDEKRLLQLHLSQTEKIGVGKTASYPDCIDGPTFVADEVRTQYERCAKSGILERREGSASFSPTLWGAYLMTWGQMWPIKPLRERLLALRAQRWASG